MGSTASRWVLLVSLALGSAGCDQWTKYRAVASLTRGLDDAAGFGPRMLAYLWHAHPVPSAPITVIEGFFRFRYAENPGAAFSFLANVAFGRWLLVLFTVTAIAAFFVWALRLRASASVLGAALVVGGGVGNLLDRLRLGYVIDFVQWHYQDRISWPIFNVADVCIFLGGVVLLSGLAREPSRATASS